MYLGLMPTLLCRTIEESIRSFLGQVYTGINLVTLVTEGLDIWEQIMELVKIKCIGLHRICGDMTKDRIRFWKNEYDIGDKYKDNRSKGKIHKAASTSNQSSHESETKETIGQKLCQGITCLNNSKWDSTKLMTDVKRIKINQKHCNKCSRTSTGLRRAGTFCMKVMEWEDSEMKIASILKIIGENWGSSLSIVKLHHSIQQCINNSWTSKPATRLKDADKIFTKIVATIFRCNITTKPLDLHNILRCNDFKNPILREPGREGGCMIHSSQGTGTLLNLKRVCGYCQTETRDLKVIKNGCQQDKYTCMSCFMRLEARNGGAWIAEIFNQEFKRKVEEKQPLSLFNQSKPPPLQSSDDAQEKVNQTEIEVVKVTKPAAGQQTLSREGRLYNEATPMESRRAATKLLLCGQPTSGDTMEIASKQLRAKLVQNLFIANSSFMELVARPRSDTWEYASRLFKSNAAKNKRDGLYLIPCFERGASLIGHHFLAIIWKRSDLHRGFILDSLQSCTSATHKVEKNLLERVFGRIDEILWIDTKCKTQCELECGARTITAMCQCVEGWRRHWDIEAIIKKIQRGPPFLGTNTNVSARTIAASVVLNDDKWIALLEKQSGGVVDLTDDKRAAPLKLEGQPGLGKKKKPNKRGGSRAARRWKGDRLR